MLALLVLAGCIAGSIAARAAPGAVPCESRTAQPVALVAGVEAGFNFAAASRIFVDPAGRAD
jgi:hypothetical protein